MIPFEREAGALKQLADKASCLQVRGLTQRVRSHASTELNTSRYSVPKPLIGGAATVVVAERHVRVCTPVGSLPATHRGRCALQPILPAIDSIAAHCEPCSMPALEHHAHRPLPNFR